MSAIVKKYLFKGFSIVLIIGLISYLTPLLISLSDINILLFFSNKEGVLAFERSVAFSFVSTILNIFFSLFIAILLSRFSLYKRTGRLISILIIPFLLGNISIAFIGKILFSNSEFFQQDAFMKFVALTIIQFWQLGTLYVYLFWLNIKSIPDTYVTYASSVKMTFGEKIKDIYLPACRNLAILLFIINFIFSIYENTKIQIIFKSSVGTHTELISQWLNRTYKSNSLINSIFANEITNQQGIIILFLTLTIILAFSWIFSKAYKKTIRFNKALNIPSSKYISKLFPAILLIFIFLPILYTIYSTIKDIKFEFIYLITPFVFTLTTSFLAVFLAIMLAIMLRLSWQKTLSAFNNRSLFFFIIIFTLQLIPPIIIYITGFQWLKIIGYQSEWNIHIAWIIGHIFLILPLILSFIIVFHFRTLNREIDYLEAHRFSLRQIIKDSFLRRYRAEYFLTFLIAFSIIWNESIINNLLSDSIPSFVSEMKMNIEGRAADYAKGMNYLFVVLGIAFTAIWLWILIIKKSFNIKNEIA